MLSPHGDKPQANPAAAACTHHECKEEKEEKEQEESPEQTAEVRKRSASSILCMPKTTSQTLGTEM